ncbi:TPA: hypothetical protein DCQ85_01060 [Candidatus Magasanikbacteria bacterium]|nr:hypothetical protein [Candidatus Magasanikbacteria bacterium]
MIKIFSLMFKKILSREYAKLINFSWRRVWLIVAVFVVLVGIFLTGIFVYAHNYKEKVLPGVYLGGVHIGGMDKNELSAYLKNMNNKLLNEGIHFNFALENETKNFILYPSVFSEDSTRDLIDVNIEEETDYLISYRKDNNLLSDTFSAIWVRLSKPELSLENIKLDKQGVFEQIHNYLEGYISEPVNAYVNIKSLKPLEYEIVSSTPGFSFDYEMVSGKILKAWSTFQVPYLDIVSFVKNPEINESDVSTIIDRLPKVLEAGPLTISYVDPYTTLTRTWSITNDNIASWLEVVKAEDGNFIFSLDTASTTQFLLDKIEPQVNIQAEDAKFKIGSNGKVSEFSGSRPGVTVDVDATLKAVDEAFDARTWHDEGILKNINLINKQTEPNIKTSEVNDLGISEVLGVGHSKFNGSPSNRIKNLRHATSDKLNGLLIKPNEDFSLVQALKPFTIADGYLPELVIKGDEIKPEVAGGLCQIGTTMFRAAMNSGLKITERRNHSLVVSYYNDLSNGNPGTDATIYDPNPDFRFLNDTGNYILVTTELNVKTYDLYIYFWGTNDGRKASYTPPVVSRWIAAGADKTIETTNLAPGVRECQLRHEGAETSFTYTRVLADGKKENVVFDSYYRPLPKICLVGVEPKKEEEVVPAEVVPESSEVIPPFDITDTILN